MSAAQAARLVGIHPMTIVRWYLDRLIVGTDGDGSESHKGTRALLACRRGQGFWGADSSRNGTPTASVCSGCFFRTHLPPVFLKTFLKEIREIGPNQGLSP